MCLSASTMALRPQPEDYSGRGDPLRGDGTGPRPRAVGGDGHHCQRKTESDDAFDNHLGAEGRFRESDWHARVRECRESEEARFDRDRALDYHTKSNELGHVSPRLSSPPH